MTGYVRNDTANNIAANKVASAADIDGEFDAIVDAFSETTGHTHDGTSAEGAPIEVTGPAQEYLSTASAFTPKTDNTYDLGSSSLGWKDLFVKGTATLAVVDINSGAIDGTPVGANSASTGAFTTLSATGQATFSDGNASAPSISNTGDTNTGFYFPGADQIGISSGGTKVAQFNTSSVDISVGISVDGVVIADQGRFDEPSNFWSTNGYYGVDGIGSFATQGSFDIALTCNGYRKGDSTWESFAVDGDTGASQVTLSGEGVVTIGCEATKSNGDSFTISNVVRIAEDQIRLFAETRPSDDDIYDLGTSSFRWDDIFATNGTIQTSDERLKSDIAPLTDAEKRVGRALKNELVTFRWNNKTRTHTGAIAQRVAAAFEAEGLDPGKYALFIKAPVTEIVTKTKMVQRQKVEDVEIEVTDIEIVDGLPVQRTKTVIKQQPAVELKQVVDAEGNAVTDKYGKPVKHPVPIMETATREYEEEQVVEGEYRYGLRYPQLLCFILASLDLP